MANYTAADVKALREATGSGMLDCKKALEENGGDYDKAVEYLRIKGAKNVSKRADREATEGLIAVSGNTMVEINCETDFVAKNEAFKTFAAKIADAAAEAKANSADELNNIEIDGKKVYGHMDYGKKDPSLGWRFTDAWLSMAGNGDKGIPNGLPVDEWGIRVDENSRPVGSCVARGGDTNGPASVYAIQKYLDWMKAYAPPAALYEQGYASEKAPPSPVVVPCACAITARGSVASDGESTIGVFYEKDY